MLVKDLAGARDHGYQNDATPVPFCRNACRYVESLNKASYHITK